jgi:hypothetical protein
MHVDRSENVFEFPRMAWKDLKIQIDQDPDERQDDPQKAEMMAVQSPVRLLEPHSHQDRPTIPPHSLEPRVPASGEPAAQDLQKSLIGNITALLELCEPLAPENMKGVHLGNPREQLSQEEVTTLDLTDEQLQSVTEFLAMLVREMSRDTDMLKASCAVFWNAVSDGVESADDDESTDDEDGSTTSTDELKLLTVYSYLMDQCPSCRRF